MSDTWDKDKLHFSKAARRGIFFFLFLFLIMAFFPRIYYNYIWKAPAYKIEKLYLVEEEKDFRKLGHQNFQIPATPFNPNTATIEDWKEIGLSEKQAQSIINYINKGGQFRIKSDLKKLYSITEELYAMLEPVIDLPEEQIFPKEGRIQREEKEIQQERMERITVTFPISINTASMEELMQVKGIGPFFAQEIIKLREAYGGIIKEAQLLEIYNMDEEKLREIMPFFVIDPSEVVKIDINTASLARLKKHPLITADMAKSIVHYRENFSPYKALDELLLSPYIDLTTYQKLRPYLKVD